MGVEACKEFKRKREDSNDIATIIGECSNQFLETCRGEGRQDIFKSHRRPIAERSGARKEPPHVYLGASDCDSRRHVSDSGLRTATAPRTGCHLRLQSGEDGNTTSFRSRAEEVFGRSERTTPIACTNSFSRR